MEELIKLTASLFLPILISGSIIYCVMLYNQKKDAPQKTHKDRLSELLSFIPEKGLLHQPPLWLALITPIAYFFVFGLFIWQPYHPKLSAEGINTFLDISKLPIALLSLSIPLSILASRFHATHQTAIQIQVTRQKNNVDGFYAHRKAMAEYFSYIESQKYEGSIEGDFDYHPRLHLKFFEHQDPTKGIPLPKAQTFDECTVELTKARAEIGEMLRKNFGLKTTLNYINACSSVSKLADIMVLPQIYRKTKRWEPKSSSDTVHITIGTNLEDLIGAYRYARSYFRVICEFSGQSTSWFDTQNIDTLLRRVDKANITPSKSHDNAYMAEVKAYLKGAGLIEK